MTKTWRECDVSVMLNPGWRRLEGSASFKLLLTTAPGGNFVSTWQALKLKNRKVNPGLSKSCDSFWWRHNDRCLLSMNRSTQLSTLLKSRFKSSVGYSASFDGAISTLLLSTTTPTTSQLITGFWNVKKKCCLKFWNNESEAVRYSQMLIETSSSS